jgi:hypothetical protein
MGYSWLDRVSFDSSEGIALRYTVQTVKIICRNRNAELRPNVRLLDSVTAPGAVDQGVQRTGLARRRQAERRGRADRDHALISYFPMQ